MTTTCRLFQTRSIWRKKQRWRAQSALVQALHEPAGQVRSKTTSRYIKVKDSQAGATWMIWVAVSRPPKRTWGVGSRPVTNGWIQIPTIVFLKFLWVPSFLHDSWQTVVKRAGTGLLHSSSSRLLLPYWYVFFFVIQHLHDPLGHWIGFRGNKDCRLSLQPIQWMKSRQGLKSALF